MRKFIAGFMAILLSFYFFSVGFWFYYESAGTVSLAFIIAMIISIILFFFGIYLMIKGIKKFRRKE